MMPHRGLLKVRLYAPPEYWNLSEEARREISNGCGPKRFGFLVPDTMYGLDVSDACDIHDYMYHVGTTLADKEEGDRVMLNNVLRIIEAKTRLRPLLWLRRRRAYKYYRAVKHFGPPAFWAGKNSDAELQEV